MARFVSHRTHSVRFSIPVFLLSTVAALAQDASLPPIKVGGALIDEEPVGLQLNRPTETGSRLGLTPMETPASVEVLPIETARERGALTINDAVARATGFSTIAGPNNGNTSLSARGFAGHAAVMQLYDGTRLYVGSGTVTFPFDAWQADRIEILRGPASVMYGEGAIGGAVNVVPRKPTRESDNEALIEFGTDMTRRVAAASSGPINSKLSYLLSTNLREADGYVDRGDNSSNSFSGAVRVEATDNLAFTLSHDQAHHKPMNYWGTPLRNGLFDESLRKKNYNVNNGITEYDDKWTQLKTDWQATDNLAFHSAVYMLQTDRRWSNVENYTLNSATNQVTRSAGLEIFHDQEQYGTRNDLTLDSQPFGLKNQTVVGFDINRIEFTNSSNSGNTLTSVVDAYNFDPGSFTTNSATRARHTSKIFQNAVFAENRLTLNDQWSVVGGLRFDRLHFNREDMVSGQHVEKDFDDLSWRGGVVYNLTPSTALYAQYATATSPVGSALLGQSAASAQLELSTAKQYEAGLKQNFMGGRGEWTFAAYQIIKNKLQTVNPAAPTVAEQIGEQSSKGIEATLSFELLPNLRLDANGALLDAQYEQFITTNGVNNTGKRPAGVPEQLANIWLTWGFAPQWKAYGGLRYVGESYANDTNTEIRPDYMLADIGVSWTPVERVTFALRVMNLFDEVYPVTTYGTNQWMLGVPRTAYLTTTVKF